ncbi:InlB B-repeat-containing protein [Christensenella minuta]|uniref:InlB B-repeat-containing protein n=1 Tax=Christensenella minuta TaxID=626937 RepID=UPI002A7FD47D|nr:InlB B-repeat-containing protein [Christensenella minuta]MDY3751279.1 InlB B-repeat-containing protein [Christensenella minuta]
MKEGKRQRILSLIVGAIMAFSLLGGSPTALAAGEEHPEAEDVCQVSEECTASNHEPGCPAAKREEFVLPNNITGFIKYNKESGDPFAKIELEHKVPQAELGLPASLGVYLDGKDEEREIPVSWVCADDYAATEYDSYTFTPVWDTDTYKLDASFSETDIPYIEVHVAQPAAAFLKDDEGNTVITVEGSDVSKTGIQAAIDAALASCSADHPAGNVKLVVNPENLKVIINNSLNPLTYINLPVDKGITSFTVTTSKEGATKDTPVILFVELGSEANIYANGIPFSVEGAISVGGTIYGGAKDETTGSTSIYYDGAMGAYNRTAIYGGGENGDVDGDTNITIRDTHGAYNNGTIFAVHGGGSARGEGHTANASGSVNIDVYGAFTTLYGGGAAYNGGTANVGGDTHIRLHGGASIQKKMYGGGYAYNFHAGDGYSGTTSWANVAGTCHIDIGTDVAQDPGFYDGDFIVGGGYATIGANGTEAVAESSAIANVGGVEIEINGNVSNNTENTNTDRCIVGGGDTDGRQNENPSAAEGMDICRADVKGGVAIKIADGVKLNNAIVGGGSSVGGGSCDVKGNVTVKIGDNAEIGGLVGGGTINANIRRAASADVGGVNIEIGNDVSCSKVGVSDGQFIAGGKPYSSYTGYSPDGSHTCVKGDIKTIIGDRFSCAGWFYSGGLNMKQNTSAAVDGNISTTLGNDCMVSQFIGGGTAGGINGDASVGGTIETAVGDRFACKGWFFGAGLTTAEKADAAVKGSVSTEFGDSCSILGQYVGGGEAEGTDSDASIGGGVANVFGSGFACSYFTPAGRATKKANVAVGSADHLVSVSTSFCGNGNDTASFTGFAVGAGRAYAADANAVVYGDTALVFDGVIPSQDLYAGGYANAAANVAVTGTATLEMRNLASEFSKFIYGGGFADASGAASDVGAAAVKLSGDQNMKGWIFGGGKAKDDATASARVLGSVSVEVRDCSLPGAYILGGGWGNGKGHVETAGKTAVDIADSTVQYFFGAGYYSADTGYQYARDITIHLDNANITGSVYPGGHNNARAEKAEIYIAGDTAVQSIHKNNSSATSGGLDVYVGGGSRKTNADIGFIYEAAVNEVHVYDGATLRHKDGSTDQLLWNAKDLVVDAGGELVLSSFDESIAGNFIGGGMLRMQAGRKLTVGGTVSGDTVMEIGGTPAAGQVYIEASGGTGSVSYSGNGLGLQRQENAGKAEWKLVDAYCVTASVPGGHGKVLPAGETFILKGGEQTFRFVPDDGYKVDRIMLDGVNAGAADAYTLSDVGAGHTLEVFFTRLVAQDVEQAIGNITPPEADHIKYADDVLEAKILYEQLTDEEKNKVPGESVEHLHGQLASLKTIQVQIEIDGEIETELYSSNLYNLAGSITLNEARQLRAGSINQIKLKLLVNHLEDEKSRIDVERMGYYEGMHLDISVVKQVDDHKEEKIPATKHHVRIEVKIPARLLGPNRTFMMLREHGGQIDVLPDLDDKDATLTVESNLFSAYAVAYTEEAVYDTVRFETQGGSIVAPLEGVLRGSLIGEPEPPVKDGFIFGGWYTEPEAGRAWRFDVDTVHGDMTLYARWINRESNSPSGDSGRQGQQAPPEDPGSPEGAPGTGDGTIPLHLLIIAAAGSLCILLLSWKKTVREK